MERKLGAITKMNTKPTPTTVLCPADRISRGKISLGTNHHPRPPTSSPSPNRPQLPYRSRKSRSASSATAPPSPPRRQDDSLIEQQDGIQNAIAHCKCSLNKESHSCSNHRRPLLNKYLLSNYGFRYPIKIMVVLVMENRSFDHMLGWMKRLNPEINGVTGSQSNPIVICSSLSRDHITSSPPMAAVSPPQPAPRPSHRPKPHC